MEFCPNKTLRDVIDDGMNENEYWRYLRQILEGLSHIHSQGMIHRDLKPCNIFLDSNGNIKIGDFGLATTDATKRSETSLNKEDLPQTPVNTLESLTTDVGTPFYMSPEQSKGVKYSQKVDMFSLGIIFFEMIFRFETGMERFMVLRNLRSPGVIFPADFDSNKSNEGKIIRMLLNHNPQERPSSTELLRSDLLPAKIENENVEETIRSITNINSMYYSKLISLLFSQYVDRHKDFTFDFNSGNNILNNEYLTGSERVKGVMINIFRRHGAVEMNCPLLMPRSILNDKPHVVRLIDLSGQVVELPYDLTVPFAMYVSRNKITNLKRFCFDRVYRQNIVGGQPRQLFECDFDIVHSTRPNMLPDAEVIKVASEVLDEFKVSPYLIRVNHIDVLNAVFDACSLKLEQREGVLLYLSQRDHVDWDNARQSLLIELHISSKSLDLLGQFLNLTGSFLEICSKLVVMCSGSQHLPKVLGRVQELLDYLTDFQASKYVIFDPCLTLNNANYCGLVFSVSVKTKKSSEVYAVGGRYDRLLKEFRHPSSAIKDCYAVGVCFSVGKLISHSFHEPCSDNGVLVCSFGSSRIAERISVACELWNANIKAEVSYEDGFNSLEEVLMYCKDKPVSWLVVLKAKSATVKLRNIEKRIEVDVPRSDLCESLSGLVFGSLRVESNGTIVRNKRLESNSGQRELNNEPSISTSVNSTNPLSSINVSFVNPKTGKMKHSQKSLIIEKGNEN
jgi:translation initiation factor 2-alpha kinase 4